MKFVLKYMRPYAGLVAVGMLLKFIGTFTDLFLPSLLEYLVDKVVPDRNIRMIVICGVLMLLISLSGYFLNITANRIASKVARNSGEKIRHDLFEKTLFLSCTDADRYTVSSLESRLTSDTYNIHNMIGMLQRIGIRAPILLFGGIIVTAFMEPVLTLVLISTLPFIVLVVTYVSKRGVTLYTKLQNAADGMVRIVRENALGVRVIKALSRQDYEANRFDEVNNTLTKEEKIAGEVMAISNPVIGFFLNIGLVLIVLVGAYRVDSGISETGKIIAFMNYFIMISNALLMITRIFVMVSKGAASAKRVDEVIKTPEKLLPIYGEKAKEKSSDVEKDICIEMRNVYFGYTKGKHDLENISFTLERGGTLGIIGGTGSGKSTLIYLLLGFYPPDSGEILIDGKSIGSYSEDKFRSKLGVAMQNSFLYSDTIAENISFGREIELTEIIKSAKTAQADSFINEKPDEYSFMLTSKGTNLSGGQKQRVIISRALAGNPEIIIMDDSESALDYRTDAALRNDMKAMGGIHTKIIVAQRVSSVMSADLILVLDAGKILAAGTHDELMENCSVYRDISETQMGGAILE